MDRGACTIKPFANGWGVEHDSETLGPYPTREAALAAAVAVARPAIRAGGGVRISVPGRDAARLAPDKTAYITLERS